MATILGNFLRFLIPLFKTPEGVVVGFQNFAWAPNKNIRIPIKNKFGDPLPPALCYNWADRGGCFQKLSSGSETLDMTSERLGEMFEGDSADMCAGKFLLVSMVGRAEGLTCADPGARTPISASGNYIYYQSSPQC